MHIASSHAFIHTCVFSVSIRLCRLRSLHTVEHSVYRGCVRVLDMRGGEAEDPGRAGRQARAVRLRADGRLRAGPRGAGEAGLCGQRANFAGAVRRLPQREDAARERAAHEFGEPRGARRHGVRPEPQAASSGF